VDGGVVHQLVANAAVVGPGRLHGGVGREGTHLGKCGLGEILVYRVQEPPLRFGGATVDGASRRRRRSGLAGLKIALILEDKLAVVAVHETCNDGSGLVTRAG